MLVSVFALDAVNYLKGKGIGGKGKEWLVCVGVCRFGAIVFCVIAVVMVNVTCVVRDIVRVGEMREDENGTPPSSVHL